MKKIIRKTNYHQHTAKAANLLLVFALTFTMILFGVVLYQGTASAELSQTFLTTNSLSITEIQKYLIVGFKKQSEGDAVNLQNGEFGADREVLSTGGTSPTGASFPTINNHKWFKNQKSN